MKTIELKIAETPADVQAGGYGYHSQHVHSIPIIGFGGAVVDKQITGGTLSDMIYLLPKLERPGQLAEYDTGGDFVAQSGDTIVCEAGKTWLHSCMVYFVGIITADAKLCWLCRTREPAERALSPNPPAFK